MSDGFAPVSGAEAASDQTSDTQKTSGQQQQGSRFWSRGKISSASYRIMTDPRNRECAGQALAGIHFPNHVSDQLPGAAIENIYWLALGIEFLAVIIGYSERLSAESPIENYPVRNRRGF